MLLRPTLLGTLPGLAAGFSTREGGVSPDPYGALNLGMSVGDRREAVAENRRRFFGALGFQPEQAAIAGQVHGDAVRAVAEPGLYPGYDALVTNLPGLLLCITAADCAAVLLADPDARVVGACHAGWRGTVAGIAARTIRAMGQMGAQPGRMRAFVSPCISRDAFEVGPEVAAQFAPAFVEPRAGANPHVDLKRALHAQLVEAGLAHEHVEVSPHCTAGQPDLFFSHRAQHGRTGRMMGAIGYPAGEG